MTKNILITTSSFQVDDNEALRQLKADGYDIVLNPYGRRLTEDEITDLLASHDPIGMIAGVEPLSAKAISASPALRVISRCGVGTDSVDLEAAKARDISVTITPGGPTVAVSELTLGLMLAACRRVGEADANIRRGEWGALMGRLLSCQTVGLIGFGRIGQAVARLCQAFGATVIASDPYAGAASMDSVELMEIDALLARADIISLHVPMSDENKHMINRARIEAMKPGSILINAARGGLIDEAALKDALESEHLAFAALDCFEDEPYQGPLSQCANVLLTCHMGSYAREARVLMEQEAAQNLLDGLRMVN